jgi:hypothetical protein
MREPQTNRMNRPDRLLEFDSFITADLAAASLREWLETNGIGGFASSTILGLKTALADSLPPPSSD